MKTIYVLRSMYLPNSAVTNRLFGHLRAFSEAGWYVEMTFLSPDPQRAKVDIEIPNVTFNYCWEESSVSNRYLKALQSYWFAWKYVKSLPSGANVLLLGMADYFQIFLSRKDINVYYEITEHPSLGRPSGFLGRKGLERHFRQCKQLKQIFVISTPLRDCYIENGIDAEKVTIVNMTVDPVRFQGLVKTEGIERYIAYCGTASNNKDGVDELLKAFAITHKTHPDVKLYIIGATPSVKDEAGNLKLIDDLGIKDAVVFTGIVPAHEMPQLLKDAAVLALDRPDSLQARHGFATKIGEYLLTGNPVVVTSVGDFPKFLQDGVSAYLSDERNAEMFASKLNQALDNPEEAAKIGECGKQVALDNFDCITEGRKFLEAIK